MITKTLMTRPEFFKLHDIRAVDGDTIECAIDLSLGVSIRRRIRLKTFFAPEHNGAAPALAEAAQRALQDACNNGVCHFQAHGMREDRYGRIAAQLWINGQPVNGDQILGPLNLSLEAHKAEVTRARQRQP